MAIDPLLRRVVYTLTWLPVGFTFLNHVASPLQVTGRSMAPALNPATTTTAQDWVVVKKWGVRDVGGLHRGDIVMFRSPHYPERLATKRVVAISGDTVYAKSPYPKLKQSVPRNHVWVEGDNGFHTVDSNTYGPISVGLVVGKVVAVVWPPSRFGTDISRGGRDPLQPPVPVM
ncbi:mitochondrial inner membrane protease subunit 2 [Diutina catenulata]